MNIRMIANLIGRILCVEALFLLPAAAVSYVYGEFDTIRAILISVVIMAAAGLLLQFFKQTRKHYYAREGFIAVAVAWIVISVFGALPFYISGEIPRFLDAVFETISGFTTTGASILTDVEAMSKGLLYWRSFTHWLGGMGVLVFVLAVQKAKGAGEGMYLMKAESPGPEVDKLVPKTGSSAKILYLIYIGLSVTQFILMALGGMPWFDNLVTVFGTAGTGGFGIKADSLGSYSPYIQTVVTIFMALCGVNFSMYYLILTGKWKQALKNEELRLYFLIQLIAVALISWNTFDMYSSLRETVHHAAFQVASIITTSGFATVNFDTWPEFSKWVLVLLMFVGASAGSTGGGIKVSRVLLIVKASLCERRRQLNPRKISLVRMDGRVVSDDTIRGIWQYMGFYLVIAAVSVLILSLDGFGFETTLATMVTCLNNIGPGLGITGPAGSFAPYSDLSKVVLCIDMLLGRLEIIPFMMLFAPSNWSKG